MGDWADSADPSCIGVEVIIFRGKGREIPFRPIVGLRSEVCQVPVPSWPVKVFQVSEVKEVSLFSQ